MANTLTPVLDLPFFELLSQARVASSAVAAMTTAEDASERYIYYLTASTFYRYDTVADTWQQLASPVVAPVTILSMRYTNRRGTHGRVLAASSTTVTIPGIRGPILDGKTIRIENGLGQGQERVLTYTGETIHDAGVITATTVNNLADSTKKWRVNQWAGYTVGITYGTDATHYKRVLYNDATTLYIADVNLQPHDPWNNQPFAANSPYALPVITAGAQAHYVIMSSQFSVPAWTVTPDTTSFFTTLTGGLYVVSSAAATPFFTFQYYDVANDTWQVKTTPQSLIGAALGTDVCIERTGKIGTALVSKVGAVSATARTLTDAGLALTKDRYANHRLFIVSGTGLGQNRRIVAHTDKVFTIPRNWDVTPDATSVYEVWPDSDRIYLAGNGAAAMFAYSPENDYWMQGQAFDDGVTCNVTATMKGWMPVNVSNSVRIAAGVTAVAAAPTAGGANYVIGDVLTCSVGGTGAQVRVTSIAPGGVVTGVELVHSGTATGFATGTGKATTGGSGNGACTINITAVGATALITTLPSHWFRTGDKVTFAGCTDAAWNAEYTVLNVPAVNTFNVVATAAAAMVPVTAAQTTTLIVDASKSWVPGEHVGRLVHLMVAGTSPTSQVRWITANTDTTLTVATIVAAVNGTSKYVIYDAKPFGVDDQRKATGETNDGWATGGSTTTLVDSTKNWPPNCWAGYMFKVEAGNGYGSGRISIISNTETTLTYATQTFTPDATTKYEIADAWGLITAGGTTTPVTEATTKNWVVNQWAGKRFRITGGTALGQETAVTSNTATALTSAALTATDATSTYAILGVNTRGPGTALIWAWGNTDADERARYMYSPRGWATNQIDVYDIAHGEWKTGKPTQPQGELFTTGSSYAYDGADTILLSRSALNTPIMIMALDLKTMRMTGRMSTTFLQGIVTVGNFMEIAGGSNEFVYVMQNTGTLFARALLF